MAKTLTNNLNMIAKGYDNYAGLTNIELIAVGGNTPNAYLYPVEDIGYWSDGQSRVTGDGVERDDGYSSTMWETGALSYSQRTYLKTSILDGQRSGKVTIKTRRDEVPTDGTMGYRYVIANAVLTLVPLPNEGKYVAGIKPFLYRFSRIVILHEDTMNGELTVTGASTAQENIDTTPEKLTAFTTAGISSGVTVSASGDSLTCIVAGNYDLRASICYTSTASTIWTFRFYVNAAAVGVKSITATNAGADPVQAVLMDHATLAAGDVVTIYVNSNDAGGTADITVVDAVFEIKSI